MSAPMSSRAARPVRASLVSLWTRRAATAAFRGWSPPSMFPRLLGDRSTASATAATGAAVHQRDSSSSSSSSQHSNASHAGFRRVSARPALSPSSFPTQPATFPSYESGLAASRDFTSSINERLNEYSRLPQRGVTLQQLLSVGERPSPLALLASAQFLSQQLPIRLAKRVMELDSLPSDHHRTLPHTALPHQSTEADVHALLSVRRIIRYGLSQTKAVQTVQSWYKHSFKSQQRSHHTTYCTLTDELRCSTPQLGVACLSTLTLACLSARCLLSSAHLLLLLLGCCSA